MVFTLDEALKYVHDHEGEASFAITYPDGTYYMNTEQKRELLERVEAEIKWLERPINYAAFMGDDDGYEDAEIAHAKNKTEAAFLRAILALVQSNSDEMATLRAQLVVINAERDKMREALIWLLASIEARLPNLNEFSSVAMSVNDENLLLAKAAARAALNSRRRND